MPLEGGQLQHNYQTHRVANLVPNQCDAPEFLPLAFT